MNSFYPFSKPGLSPQDTKQTSNFIPILINSPDQFLFSAFGTSPLESTEDHPLNRAESTNVCVSTNSSVFVQGYISLFPRYSLRPTSPDILSQMLVASAKVTASGMIT